MEQSNKQTDLYLKCADYFNTGEEFNLLYDSKMDMLVTSPMPSEGDLMRYYDSPNYLSHAVNDKTIYQKIYFFVRRISITKKLRLISRLKPKGVKLLDVGAGAGHFIHSAIDSGWDGLGVEINKGARFAANSIKPNVIKDVAYLQGLSQNSFDVITLWHVLEHMSDLDLEINRLKTLLSFNGRLVIAVPNFKSYDAHYFQKYWAGYDVPRHLWHFSRSAIVKLFGRHGMQVESTHPMVFDSFFVSLLSTKYKFGSFRFFKAILVGLVSNIKAAYSGEYSSLIYIIKKQ